MTTPECVTRSKNIVDALPDTEAQARMVIKAKAFAFVLDNMRIGINEHDYFPILWNWNRPLNFCTINRWLGEVKLSEEEPKGERRALPLRRHNLLDGLRPLCPRLAVTLQIWL